MIGQIKMLGHGKTSSMIAGIMIVSFHRPKVLTKTVCKFTASFPNVQHVTSLAEDRVDHASGSTIEPLFEVNTSARGSYRISLRRVVTGATPGSVAWKCCWWCLVLLWAGGYPRDLRVNYARFNGFLSNVSYSFQNLGKALRTLSLKRSS